MSELRVTAAVKHYGAVTALDGVELTVPAGDLVAVLGPSGCGKTTLLRCVAGFERLDAGAIEIDGRPVAGPGRHVTPERRRVAVVPQEGALFPHLSVAGNVGYGLDRRTRRSHRVDEVLELVGLAGYQHRMPHQLSGGQQQRVAVARALAPRPPLVLLDEPFSALDAGLRVEVRADIRAALRADGATAVLVTHDQGEALSMADQVAVMRDGRILQAGPPAEVYAAPVDTWTAQFVGEAVLLPGTVTGDRVRTVLGELAVRPGTHSNGDGEVRVMIRPEQFELLDAAGPESGLAPATVVSQAFHGHDALLTLRLDDGTLVTARIFGPGVAQPAGRQVSLRIRDQVRVY
ncbi:MAG: ABC transporter ATP-binding protein [Micromonosporaceae bacterium]